MKKHLSVFTASLFLVLAFTTAQASIIHVDLGGGVNPELEQLEGGFGSLGKYTFSDMGNERLNLHYAQISTPLMNVKSTTGMGFKGVIGTTVNADPSTYNYAAKLDAGVRLGKENPDWLNNPNDSSFFLYLKDGGTPDLPDTEWEHMSNGGKGYLGFSFGTDGDTRFGWAELFINSDSGFFTLYGYAWETEAGKSILTGDTGSSPVPVPAAVWLLGSGLVGLAGMRKKTCK